jgi:ApaG protein
MVLIARMVGTLPGHRTGIVTIARGFPTLNCRHAARYEVAPAMNKGSPSMYRATTRGIEVQVTPRFLSDRSSPENGYYFWAYTIEITNRGPATVQLKTRHWRITDAHGKLQEVRGAGVVGETPTLEPGESFEYTSGVPLPTPSGFMTGTYGMVTVEGGEGFDIQIPAFSLDSAQGKPTLN